MAGEGSGRLVCFRLLQIDAHICYSNFASSSVNAKHWVLGEVFLRLYFTVFDRANDRIGLAPVAVV